MSHNLAVRSQDYRSVRAHAAKVVIKDTIRELGDIVLPGPQVPSVPPPAGRPKDGKPSTLPICIIGAGCAGLYAAMILDTLELPYEILEASDRIGGRIYTHRFNGEKGRKAPIGDPARYDYTDIGAMRFPNIPFMDRVFDLFKLLDMDKDGLLIEYIYDADNTFQLYNGRRHNDADPTPTGEDTFYVSQSNGGAVPDWYVGQGVDNVASDVFKPFSDAFKNMPFRDAWQLLTWEDHYSTRGYLLAKKQYPETVIEWLETFQTATGLYNDAFVESVMDAMDFGSSTASTDAGMQARQLDYDWYCIDGGSDHLTSRMAGRVKSKPKTRARVTKIASTPSGEMTVEYQTDSGTATTKYSQVVCTVPLGCLAAIDIPVDDLSYTQRLAIRSLNYDTSTKVALKFESRWWEDPNIMGNRTIKGGVSSTDLPIRTCVYPSYGFNATGKPPGVILASYTWAQDAQRLGGLAQGNGTEADARLVELTLQNLSQLHDVPVDKFGKLVDHYAYNWHNDENARGAFALFGPNQFGWTTDPHAMFASMKAPAANGKLHIAGEATSAHHAWVLGALNSAWRAVYNALGNLSPQEAEKKRKLLVEKWGTPDEEETESLLKLAALAYNKVL